ncbi:hypothetical protein PIB30_095068, partial [Stylosanthes scabra]|nr:hypothetical protein [Stylosanthes scabra]
MFSLRFPIPTENTLTSLPKTTNNNNNCNNFSRYSYSCRSFYASNNQQQRFLLTDDKLGGGIRALPPSNVALHNNGASVVGGQPETVEEPFPEELRAELMPKHVAVIMDGNRRWAKERGLFPWAGHQAGVEALKEVVRLSCSWGIKVLTVFAFSYENWIRPK